MKSKVRYGSGGAEFGCLLVLFVSSRSALIRSHSPVSRSSSFRQLYTVFSLLCFVASQFWFWLGLLLTIARTPTTILFQYISIKTKISLFTNMLSTAHTGFISISLYILFLFISIVVLVPSLDSK